jgi:hypothetical protein
LSSDGKEYLKNDVESICKIATTSTCKWLFAYKKRHNGWQKFWDYLSSTPNTGGDFTNIVPILAVGDSDLLGSSESIKVLFLYNFHFM